MRRSVRFLAFGAVGIAAAVTAASLGARAHVRGSVADYEGILEVRGLDAPVDISFDSMGVPHVWAASDADMFYTLGWLHASERLFQMELVRRYASGALAEVFGEDALPVDIEQRRMGFQRRAVGDAALLGDTARAVVERYVAGVNEWIRLRDETNRLPPEFAILRFTPRPWTVEDVIAVGYYQTWYAHDLSDQDDAYDMLARAVGPAAEDLLRAGFPHSRPSAGAPAGVPSPPRMTGGSNSWAVAPGLSASGHSLHASDPHLEINSAPGFWYAVALHSAEGTDLIGVTAPGLPSVAMGHNGHVAWSFTVAAVDLADHFRIRRSTDDSLLVQAGAGWARMEVIEERIAVAGRDQPHVLPVEVSPRGPVVAYDSAGAVALYWAGFDFPATAVLDAGPRLHRARSIDEARRAVTSLGALDVNWILSSRDGRIGYQLGSPIPIRSDTLPSFAIRDAAAGPSWNGYRPLGETPHAVNPQIGWVASCNNRPAPPDWPYELPGFYDPYRIERAARLLSADSLFTAADMERFQMDIASERAHRWRRLAADGARAAGEAQVARSLEAWDGTMDVSDTLATVFALWWHHMTPALFADDAGPEWRWAGDLQELVLTDSVRSLIDDSTTPELEDATAISVRAMREALRDAAGRPWGEVHTLTVRHPLAVVAVLDRTLGLTRGPFPWEGDATTLAAALPSLDRRTATFSVEAGPSMRFVLDWADPDSFTLTPALGQSGHPHSPHFADFLPLSRAGRRWTVPLTRPAADARRASLLRLIPA